MQQPPEWYTPKMRKGYILAQRNKMRRERIRRLTRRLKKLFTKKRHP